MATPCDSERDKTPPALGGLHGILKVEISGSITRRFFIGNIGSNHSLSRLSQIQRAIEQLHGAIKNRHVTPPLVVGLAIPMQS
jgi:hypothetical protein